MIKLSKEVIELAHDLHQNYLEELECDEYYDDSVIAGCDCGCGGDSMIDSFERLYEDREEILTKLYNLGYTVEEDQEGE